MQEELSGSEKNLMKFQKLQKRQPINLSSVTDNYIQTPYHLIEKVG